VLHCVVVLSDVVDALVYAAEGLCMLGAEIPSSHYTSTT
jgi:hypothetical protein